MVITDFLSIEQPTWNNFHFENRMQPLKKTWSVKAFVTAVLIEDT